VSVTLVWGVLQNLGVPVIFLQRLKPSSNLVCWWGLPRLVVKLHLKSGGGRRLRKLPKMWGFPFNISAIDEALPLQIGMQLGFVKAYRNITLRRKSEHGRVLGYSFLKFGVPI